MAPQKSATLEELAERYVVDLTSGTIAPLSTPLADSQNHLLRPMCAALRCSGCPAENQIPMTTLNTGMSFSLNRCSNSFRKRASACLVIPRFPWMRFVMDVS